MLISINFSGVPSQTMTRRQAFLLLFGKAFFMWRNSMTRAEVFFQSIWPRGQINQASNCANRPNCGSEKPESPLSFVKHLFLSQKLEKREAITFASKRGNTGMRQMPWCNDRPIFSPKDGLMQKLGPFTRTICHNTHMDSVSAIKPSFVPMASNMLVVTSSAPGAESFGQKHVCLWVF